MGGEHGSLRRAATRCKPSIPAGDTIVLSNFGSDTISLLDAATLP